MVNQRFYTIGASDVGDLMNIEPYGCKRKLYFKYTGEEETDKIDKSAMKRGKELEKLILEKYIDEFNPEYYEYQPELNPIEIHGKVVNIHPDLIADNYIVELKTKGSKYMPLNESYYYQVIFQMYATGINKGRIYVLNIDTWDTDLTEIQYSDESLEEIIKAIKYFGNKIPERLMFNSKACKNCPYFSKCWADDLLQTKGVIESTSKLSVEIQQYLDFKSKEKEYKKSKASKEKIIIDFLVKNQKETVITDFTALSLKKNAKSITLKEEKI